MKTAQQARCLEAATLSHQQAHEARELAWQLCRLIAIPGNLLDEADLIGFWANQAPKFDKWVNLVGSVEGRLLPHQSVGEFYLPQALRQVGKMLTWFGRFCP